MNRYIKTSILAAMTVITICCTPKAAEPDLLNTHIIAHRGYWDREGSAQNSIASLRMAQELGCYGSEFDVNVTGDGVAVINHDATIDGFRIPETYYQDLKECTLADGEHISTLKQYLEEGIRGAHANMEAGIFPTKLILEIKTGESPEHEDFIIKTVADEVRAAGFFAAEATDPYLREGLEFISFSPYICLQIQKEFPGVPVAYLEGDMSPAQAKDYGLTALDYHYSRFISNPGWIEEAHQLGMKVNVWTVDDPALAQRLLDSGADYITTNAPEMPLTLPALPEYICHKKTGEITIDGLRNESAWEGAEECTSFHDISGYLYPEPLYRTSMKMLWDDEALYIGVELEEPRISASKTEHDSVVWHDNDFELFLDPFGRGENYYEIEINALGTIFDLQLTRPYSLKGSAVTEWECEGMEYAVSIDGTVNDSTDVDRGWSFEMKIPYKALTGEYGNPADSKCWNVTFSRVEWLTRPECNWVWSPTGKIDIHLPDRWGSLKFVR